MPAKATIADDMSIIGDPCIREAEVWKMLRRHGIVSASAYRLGRSRLSCIACIFGNPDQWASMRHLAPDWFERIDTYEDGFGRSIQRRHGSPDLARLALEHAWGEPVLMRPSVWTMPAGAFGDGSGPS